MNYVKRGMRDSFVIDREIVSCTILRRINRFVVEALIENRSEHVHLTNTGKLEELLIRGRKAYCYKKERSRLKYRLYAVEESYGYAFIDTYLQEISFAYFAKIGAIPWLGKCQKIKKGFRVKRNVYDFVMECSTDRYIVETKSATLRVDRTFASYPDTKTERGIRHIYQLPRESQNLQMRPLLVFIAGLKDVVGVIPNDKAEPRISKALKLSIESGLIVKALSLVIEEETPSVIRLDKSDIPLII